MKISHKLNIIALAVIILTFTACKKSATPAAKKTTTNTIDYKALASQVGTSIYSSFSGTMVNSKTNNSIRNRIVLDISSLCGYTLDTAYTIDSVSASGTRYDSKNSYVLINTCSSGAVNGYTVTDTIINSSYYADGRQDILHFTALDTVTATDNTFKFYNLSGESLFNGLIQGPYIPNPNSQTMTTIYNNIKIDVSSGTPDFTSGTAIFSGVQYVLPSSLLFSGKINYLGNYEAQVVFDSPGVAIPVYTINIITGAIVSTP